MADRWKQIAASFLAFGALAIPGFSGLVTALGGDSGDHAGGGWRVCRLPRRTAGG